MRFRGALCAATILAAPVIASAQPVTGVYVGLGAGFNYQEQQGIGSITIPGPVIPGRPLTATTNSLNLNTGTGYVLLGSLGWGFGNGLRVELEGRYSDNGVNKITGTPGPNSASGRSQIYGAMGNVLYDFDLSSYGIGGFFPYIGVGAGYGWQNIALNFNSSPNPFNYAGHISGTEGSFAAQAIGGFAIPIAAVPGLSFTAEYRYFARIGNETYNGYVQTPGATVATTRTTATRFTFNSVGNQEGLVGFRYAFNVAPPPPPPPPPPPVVAPTRSYLVFFDWDKATLTARAQQIIARGGRRVDPRPVHADRGERLHGYVGHAALQPGPVGASRRGGCRGTGARRRAAQRDQHPGLRRDAPARADRPGRARAAEPPRRDHHPLNVGRPTQRERGASRKPWGAPSVLTPAVCRSRQQCAKPHAPRLRGRDRTAMIADVSAEASLRLPCEYPWAPTRAGEQRRVTPPMTFKRACWLAA